MIAQIDDSKFSYDMEDEPAPLKAEALALRGSVGIKDPLPANMTESVNELDRLWHHARVMYEQAYVCALIIIEVFLQTRLVTAHDYDAAIRLIEEAHVATGHWEKTPFWRPTYSDLCDWRTRHGWSSLISSEIFEVTEDYEEIFGDKNWVESRDELRELIRKIQLWSDAHRETNVALAMSVLSNNPALRGCRDLQMVAACIPRVVAERRLGHFKANIGFVGALLRHHQGPMAMHKPFPSHKKSFNGLEPFASADVPCDAAKKHKAAL